MRINLPTWLTLFRILLLPVVVVAFYLPWRWASLAAAGVFVAAALTDWLDGWLARKLRQTSPFGAFLDPVADKLMVTVALFLLVSDHPSALLALTSAVIVGREIGVSALREWMAELGQRARVRVQLLGKLKTMVQFVAIVVLLVEHDANTLRFYKVGEMLLLLAAALTLISGFGYLRAAWPSLSEPDPRDGG
jgi:CDP-diacylglycerol--glycerol-3-phosphate 3-phosphatidyltransferase